MIMHRSFRTVAALAGVALLATLFAVPPAEAAQPGTRQSTQGLGTIASWPFAAGVPDGINTASLACIATILSASPALYADALP